MSWSRRDLLRLGGAGACAWLARPWSLSAAPDEPSGRPLPASILIWLDGGASAFETFDPKPGTPTGGPTRAIPTSSLGLQFAASLPRLAERSEGFAVIRALRSREGDHVRANRFLRTGRPSVPGFAAPGLAAMLASESLLSNPRSAVLPPWISIGGSALEPEQGYLSSSLAPLRLTAAGAPIPEFQAPAGISRERQQRRLELLRKIDAGEGPVTSGSDDPRHEALDAALSLRERPELAAFDLSKAPAVQRARYGESELGRSCLLASRLVAAGARCVELRQGGWDTHEDNFRRSEALAGQLDQALSALLEDLQKSGQLAHTLVAVLTEFGRTATINGRNGRDHEPGRFCALLAGARIKPGSVYGESSADGREIVKEGLGVPELTATLILATGGQPDREYRAGDRPVKLSDGAPCKALLV
jgi:hypothetical protein